MSIRRATLISNPKTGRYGARRLRPIQDVASQLRSLGIEVDLKLTARAGEATEIAAHAASNGSSDVIVAGGDGTINEAIQGMAGSKARLAIIPRGTANVLARELNLPLNDEQAIAVAARGTSRRIHLGRATEEATGISRLFVLMAGIGLDASVVQRTHPRLKKRLGKGAFWISGFGHLADWKPKLFTLEIDGQEYPATFAAIGKASRYGGDLFVTPNARLEEPQFEVCTIMGSSPFRYLHLLSYAVRQTGIPHDKGGVRFVKTAQLRATGDAPVQVDGELIGTLPMRFEIASESLEVIVP